MKTLSNLLKLFLLCFFLLFNTIAEGQAYVNISTQSTCTGGNMGAIELSFVASILNDYPMPYLAEWENLTNGDYTLFQVEELNTVLSNLEAGEYEIIIELSADCELTLTAMVESEPLYIADYVHYDLPCRDEETGMLTVVPLRGQAPYTFEWSNGSTTATAENLGAGWYQISITDANGCRQQESVSLLDKAINVETHIDHLCSADGDLSEGAIEVEVRGTGTPPYTYQWSTGATTPAINNLYAGLYTLTITDAESCTEEIHFQIMEKEIMLSAQLQHPACEGAVSQATGRIVLQIDGTGHAPYTYQWSNGATTADLDQLTAGTYEVTVTDADGCEESHFFELEAIGKPVILDIYAISSFCAPDGEALGSASVLTEWGNPTIEYISHSGNEIIVPPNDPRQMQAPAGRYTVIVTDEDTGCSTSEIFEIYDQSGYTIHTEIVEEPSCPCCQDGKVIINIVGGFGPFEIRWLDQQVLTS